jgi:prepilin-type processing-associated H-X9-DG protein
VRTCAIAPPARRRWKRSVRDFRCWRHRTLSRILAANGAQSRGAKPRWVAAGLLASAAAIIVIAILPVLSRARESARRASTQGNMKQLGLVFKMYANEHTGERFPQLAAHPGAWVPNFAGLYPDILTSVEPLISEEHPDREELLRDLRKALQGPAPNLTEAERLVGESFGYLGYSLKNETEFEVVRKAKASSPALDPETPVNDPETGVIAQPLREGIERFLLTDINNPAGSASAQSAIPVLVEIATWKHKKSVDRYMGANVLYMDGHVAFVRYGTFPVVDSVLNALSGLTP